MFKDDKLHETRYCENCLKLQMQLQAKEQECESQKQRLEYYIEKTTQLLDDIDNNDFDCENCSSLDEDTVCTYKLKKIILDIINKAKEDQ